MQTDNVGSRGPEEMARHPEDQSPGKEPTQASEDEDFYEKEYARKEPGIQTLCFRLGSEWYAVEMDKAVEAFRVDQLAYLPSAPYFIAGITNIRGNILPVMDPKKLFGLAATSRTDKSRIIVVSALGIQTGLLVDEILNVVDVASSRIDPPLSTLDNEKAQFLRGEFKLGNRLVTVMNVENVLAKTGNPAGGDHVK